MASAEQARNVATSGGVALVFHQAFEAPAAVEGAAALPELVAMAMEAVALVPVMAAIHTGDKAAAAELAGQAEQVVLLRDRPVATATVVLAGRVALLRTPEAAAAQTGKSIGAVYIARTRVMKRIRAKVSELLDAGETS